MQNRISATSFLVLINLNKFGIIFIESFVMVVKTSSVSQVLGGSAANSGRVLCGQTRKAIEESAQGEMSDIVEKMKSKS